ncbi:MAG: twin transmembrane helix small protein [Pseudomonadota bacterium]
MSETFFYAALVACLFTAIVLMIGILGFGLKRSSPSFSNKMMRWRIIGQFVAIGLIMATILVTQGG